MYSFIIVILSVQSQENSTETEVSVMIVVYTSEHLQFNALLHSLLYCSTTYLKETVKRYNEFVTFQIPWMRK